jgi:hypothetical protein
MRRRFSAPRVALLVVTCSLFAWAPVVAPPTPARAATWSIADTASYAPGRPGLYAYAPSAIQDHGSTYYFTCHNSRSGVIRDSIWFAQVDRGRVVREEPVLSPDPGGWDSYHVCDPSVVAGSFGFRGATYSYAMFYLGTARHNTANQIGVAFADNLAGPWVRAAAPLVTIPRSASSTWGVGQPSATTLDPATGSVLLFYRRHLVLGDAADWRVGRPLRVTTVGLSGDVLHDFDVAYDRRRDRFYIAREAGPAPTSAPTNVSTSVEVDSISGDALESGSGGWRVEGRITPAITHLPRNHNPGIVRTPYGALPDSARIDVVVSRATTGAFPAVLFTYDLWTVSRKLAGAIADR